MAETMKATDLQLMPDVLDIREITFTNLLLLEFDPAAHEAKYRIPFNRDMFAFPNKKGMEVILYFLFSKLNPDAAQDEFRHCWPIHDKKQEQSFRKVVILWLSQLSKEDPECHIPRTFPSLLLDAGGEKVYRLLFHFTTYILQVKLKEIAGKKLQIPPYPRKTGATKTVLNRMSKIYAIRTVLDAQRMLEYAQASTTVQERWLSFSSTLVKEHRALRKSRREWEKKLADLDAKGEEKGYGSQSLPTESPYTKDVQAIRRTKLLQKVRQQLKNVTQLYGQLSKAMETIDEVLGSSVNNRAIQGSNLSVKIPERLLREFEDEIAQRRIENIYYGGKLNLISLVQLWNLSLVMIKEKLEEVSMPDFTQDEVQMRARLHHHTACLEIAKSLHSSLENEVLPDIKESIQELIEVVDLSEKRDVKKAFQVTKLGLELMSATPDRFTVDTTSNLSVSEAERTSVFGNIEVKTPDAVSSLLQSVKERQQLESTRETKGQVKVGAIPVRGNHSSSKKKPSFIPRIKESFLAKETEQSETRKAEGVQQGQSATRPKKEGRKKSHRSLFVAEQSNKHRSKYSEEEVKEQLADKIVADVIKRHTSTVQQDSSESESSQTDTDQEQALKDPIAALGKEGFRTKRDLFRTPRHPKPDDPEETAKQDENEGIDNTKVIFPDAPHAVDDNSAVTQVKKDEGKKTGDAELDSIISRYKQLKLKAKKAQINGDVEQKHNSEKTRTPLNDRVVRNVAFSIEKSLVRKDVITQENASEINGAGISQLDGKVTEEENVSKSPSGPEHRNDTPITPDVGARFISSDTTPLRVVNKEETKVASGIASGEKEEDLDEIDRLQNEDELPFSLDGVVGNAKLSQRLLSLDFSPYLPTSKTKKSRNDLLLRLLDRGYNVMKVDEDASEIDTPSHGVGDITCDRTTILDNTNANLDRNSVVHDRLISFGLSPYPAERKAVKPGRALSTHTPNNVFESPLSQQHTCNDESQRQNDIFDIKTDFLKTPGTNNKHFAPNLSFNLSDNELSDSPPIEKMNVVPPRNMTSQYRKVKVKNSAPLLRLDLHEKLFSPEMVEYESILVPKEKLGRKRSTTQSSEDMDDESLNATEVFISGMKSPLGAQGAQTEEVDLIDLTW